MAKRRSGQLLSTICPAGDTMISMSEIKDRKDRKVRIRIPDGTVSLLCACLTGAVMALVWGGLSHLFHLESRFSNTAIRQLFDQPFPVQLALYGVISPVLEELLFRRFIYDLLRKVMSERAAAVLTAALFALWHWNLYQILYAFPAGLILQALRASRGRMEEPVLCHISANLTAILISALFG